MFCHGLVDFVVLGELVTEDTTGYAAKAHSTDGGSERGVRAHASSSRD